MIRYTSLAKCKRWTTNIRRYAPWFTVIVVICVYELRTSEKKNGKFLHSKRILKLNLTISHCKNQIKNNSLSEKKMELKNGTNKL